MSLAQFRSKGRMPAGEWQMRKGHVRTKNGEITSKLNSNELFHIDGHVHLISSNTSQNYRKYFSILPL